MKLGMSDRDDGWQSIPVGWVTVRVAESRVSREPSSACEVGSRRRTVPVDAGAVASADPTTSMHVRPYQPADLAEWLRLRRALWPELAGTDEAADAAEWLARPDATVIVAARADGQGL